MRMNEQTTEFLKCYFTPDERAELSERLCRALALKLEKEEEFKAVKQQFKEAIELQLLEVNRLGRRLNFGYEHRNVACEILLNTPEPGRKTVIRTDVPGELVRTMSMDGEDAIAAKAGELFPEPKAAAIETVLEKVADQINSGALDVGDVKCTAEVMPATVPEEVTAEERQRTKRQRKVKMQGQDAILPDKRTTFPHGHNPDAKDFQ
jgi:hypothetical protein